MKIWQSDKKIIKFLRISWKSIIIDSFIDTAVTKETAKRGWFLEVYLKCVKMCQNVSNSDVSETFLRHFWDYWQNWDISETFLRLLTKTENSGSLLSVYLWFWRTVVYKTRLFCGFIHKLRSENPTLLRVLLGVGDFICFMYTCVHLDPSESLHLRHFW